MDRLLSVHEIAELLGLRDSTVYKYVSMRKIPFIKIGARVLFDVERTRLWVEEKSVEPVNYGSEKKITHDS